MAIKPAIVLIPGDISILGLVGHNNCTWCVCRWWAWYVFTQNNSVHHETDTLPYLQIVYRHWSISVNYKNRKSYVYDFPVSSIVIKERHYYQSTYLWTSSINSGSKWSMQVKNMNFWMPNTGNHVNKMPTTVMLCGHIAFTIVYSLCESGII